MDPLVGLVERATMTASDQASSPNDGETCRLQGKVAWVTGAAGGIGAAVVDELIRQGATVIASDLDSTTAINSQAVPLPLDVTDPDQISQVAREIGKRFGAPNIFIGCAAKMARQDFFSITADDWDNLFAVNARGLFLCSQGASKLMVEAKQPGVILTIGSLGSEIPREDIVQYCASKGAVQSLTYAMSSALAPRGIRVLGVMPGTIQTEMNADRWAIPGAVRAASAKVPLGRLGTPEDIAPIICFLASDSAAYATGSMIRVDGGRLTAG